MKKAFVIFASLMVCIFIFFGCTAAPETTATTPPTSTTQTTTTPAVPVSILECPQGPPPPGLVPQYGGTLKEIWGAHPSNIGAPWLLLSGPNKMISRYAIESLNGVGVKGEMVPQLATSWAFDEANKTITFTLREGVKFHDGTNFDAEAVKWNLEKSIAAKNPAMQLVSSVVAVDSTHVRINLTSWDPFFLNSLCANTAGAIVSPTAAKALIAAGKEGDIALTPVGTGPFKFVSFTPDVIVKFTKFEGYWQKGLPYLDAVEVNLVYDATVALTSFRKGEVQYLEGVLPKDAKGLKDDGYTITQMVSAVLGITGDSANPDSPFADIRLRRAICYAIDKTIADSVYQTMYPSTNQWAGPGMTAWDSSIQGYPYNVDKAKALLAELNISVDHPLNVKFTFAEGPQTKDFYLTVQSYLAKVGINLEFDIITGSAWNSFRMGEMHNQMSEFNTSYNGIEFVYSDTLKQSMMTGSVWYKSVWTSPAYNALLQQMLPETDAAKREAYYQQLNKMAVDTDCVACPTYLKLNFKAAQPNLIDMGCGNIANEFLPERAWLKQ